MRSSFLSPTYFSRRHFLKDCGVGLGKIGLAGLLAESAAGVVRAGQGSPLEVKAPHFAPKAKRVIHLFMAGAPSQLEMFDYKPALTKYEGKPIPPEIIGGQRYAFIRPDAAALGPRFKFNKHGQCGAELGETLPYLAKVVDDITIIKSVHTDQFNHAPAQIFSRRALPCRAAPASAPGPCTAWVRKARTCPPLW